MTVEKYYGVFRKAWTDDGTVKWARLHVTTDYKEAQQVAREMRQNTQTPHKVLRLWVVATEQPSGPWAR